MSDSDQFITTSYAKVKEPVVRGRFLFLDRDKTAPPSGSPVGISYFTQIPTTYCGKAQYYNMGLSIPVKLELAGDINIGCRVTYDSLGRGIYACQDPSYALAREGGSSGDYITVLMQYLEGGLTAFSNAFAPCEFK